MALYRKLAGMLRPKKAPARKFAGFIASSVDIEDGNGDIVINLTRRPNNDSGATENLLLEVRIAREGGFSYYRQMHGLAISYRDLTPLDSLTRHDAMNAFLAFVDSAFGPAPRSNPRAGSSREE